MAYLSRSVGTRTDRSTWTFSTWVRLNEQNINQYQYIFSQNEASGGQMGISIAANNDSNNGNGLYVFSPNGGGTQMINTSRDILDTSSYTHVVLKCSSNSYTLYFNGTQIDTGTVSFADSGGTFWIGTYGDSQYLLNGYQSDICFVDGQALNPSVFGEELSNGTWNPKAPKDIRTSVGSFGAQGFFLTFDDSSNVGYDYQSADRSGTTNDFTVGSSGNTRQHSSSGIDNKFATLDQMYTQGRNGANFQFGNLKAYTTTAAHTIARTDRGLVSGKWYWEAKIDGGNPRSIGVVDEKIAYTGTYVGGDDHGWGTFIDTGSPGTLNNYYNGSTIGNTSINVNDTDTVMFAYDRTLGRLWIGVNGVWVDSGDPANNSNPKWTGVLPAANVSSMMFPAHSIYGGGTGQGTYHYNFGDPTYSISSGNADDNGYGEFEYDVPTGFLAICDANMKSTHTLVEDSLNYFKTGTYGGNGTAGRLISTDFAPDLAFVKSYSGNDASFTWRVSSRPLLSRVDNRYVAIDQTLSWQNQTNGYIDSFESNGFTVTNNGSGGVNEGSGNYVYHAWGGNGSVESTTDSNGATVTRSVTAAAGISVINYTGTGVSRTIPHGLGRKPSMILIKGDQTSDWRCYHIANSGTDAGRLHLPNNQSGFIGTGHGYLRGTQPTDTTITLPETAYNGHGNAWESNTNGIGYEMYVFAEIPGFSAFGVYRGDSSNKVHVTTNFKPQLVTLNWYTGGGSPTTNMRIHERTLSPFSTGGVQNVVYWSVNAGQQGQNGLDMKSNGFTVNSASDVNHSSNGNYYMYAAWAESPYIGYKNGGATARW